MLPEALQDQSQHCTAVMVTVNTKRRFLAHLGAKKRTEAEIQRALEATKQDKRFLGIYVIRKPIFWLQGVRAVEHLRFAMLDQHFLQSLGFGNLGIFNILSIMMFYCVCGHFGVVGLEKSRRYVSLVFANP